MIEAFGSTSLTEVGTTFYLDDSSGAGPSLKYQGANFVAGQFGQWTPIGAEQTTSGYEVAWKVAGADQYTVWSTDSNGNYTSNIINTVAGTDPTLVSLETSFHQDLNGDGVIGPATTQTSQTVIEAFGSTSLTEVGTHFYLRRQRRGRSVAEVPGRGLCGGSIWPMDADWRGADDERV